MYPILQLRGDFKTSPNPRMFPSVTFPAGKEVKLSHLHALRNQLQELQQLWNSGRLIDINPLITIAYHEVVAKSNRIHSLLLNNITQNNQAVVGVRIVDKHSEITYSIPPNALSKSLQRLSGLITDLEHAFPGCQKITSAEIKLVKENKIQLEHTSTTQLQNLLIDALHVDFIYLSTRGAETLAPNGHEQLVSFYKTNLSILEIYRKIFGLRSFPTALNDTTLLLNEREIKEIINVAPFLIAMSTIDENSYEYVNFADLKHDPITIPEPNNEPTIGVIDTQFSTEVYFADWVDNHNTISDYVPDDHAMRHGTAVTSIIVDGPAFNPQLDDGCGRFRVKFFGVAQGKTISSYHLLKTIDKAIHENPEIKVWNISLGSNYEVSDEFISLEAAFLDNLQAKKDVIFVIAATNNNTTNSQYKIGVPADSLNSLVVGSVNSHDQPASYSRVGNVLSFFIKPDVSYYGGDNAEPIFTCTNTGLFPTSGTSYAARWISRKLAYLIHYLNLDKAKAKALLIDAAAGWNQLGSQAQYQGYGVVPIHINEIISCSPDEIKLCLSHKADGYKSSIMNLPVPLALNKQKEKVHNYLCKFTLCYFPECSRNQGVDYTNIEMDVHLGIIRASTTEIVDAFKNTQTQPKQLNLPEAKVRSQFRKWDNSKHQVEPLLTPKLKKRKAKKALNDLGNWGLEVIYKQRLNISTREPMNFGLVITFKEIDGKDNYHHFIRSCESRGWVVTQTTNVELNLYQQATHSLEDDPSTSHSSSD